MLLGEDLGWRHERDLQPVLHRDERRQQRDDGFACPDVALQQPVHRVRPLQIVDDLLERLPLPRRQPERQHLTRRLANPIVHRDELRFPLGRGRPAPREHAGLEQKRLFEDQAPLRRRLEPVERVERHVGGRKMRGEERGAARRQLEAQPNRVRKMIGKIRRQPLQRVVHQLALNLRRDAAGLFIHRHDPARVNRLAILIVQDFVLRVRELQAAVPPHLDRPKQDDVLAAGEHVVQKRLIEPRHEDRPGPIVHGRVEDLEAGPARRSQMATENPAGDRGGLSGLERDDRLQAAAIFVADRKAIQQIFDGDEARVFEIGGTTRPDALEKLQGRGEHVVVHCTTTA